MDRKQTRNGFFPQRHKTSHTNRETTSPINIKLVPQKPPQHFKDNK